MAIKVPIITEYNAAGLTDAERALGRFGVKSTSELKKAGLAFGVLAGAGAAAFSQLDAGYDAIITGTGATGAALQDLKDQAADVAEDVPQSFGEVGAAIAEVNTRLGLTGDPLEAMTERFLNLSRITGEDVVDAIDDSTRVFGDWGVTAEQQSLVLDQLYKATQDTGIGFGELSRLVVQFGAPLRQLGFSLEESIALFSAFEAQGVNTETVMAGLRQGLSRMAQAGEEPVDAFQRITDQIANAGSTAEANKLAIETFGARAGPDMAAAIREGRFELDDLVASLGDAEGSIDAAADATLSAQDRFKMLGNQLLVAAAPAVEIFAEVLDQALSVLGLLPRPVQGVVVAVGALAVASSGARSAMAAFGREIKLTQITASRFFVPAMVGAGAALIAYAGIAQDAAEVSERAAAGVEELAAASDAEVMRAFTDALADQALTTEGLEGQMRDVAEANLGAAARVLEMEDATGGLTKHLVGMGASADTAALVVGALRDAVAEQVEIQGNAAESAAAAARATEAEGDAAEVAAEQIDTATLADESRADALEEAARLEDELTQEIDERVAALEAEADALDAAASAMRAQADANLAALEAGDNWNKTLEENTEAAGKLEEGTAELRAVQIETTRAAADLADATVRQATEAATAEGRTLSNAQAQGVWNRSMVASARQAKGPLRDAIINYIATVNGIPPEKVSEILADPRYDTINKASRALNKASKNRKSSIRAEALTSAAESQLAWTARTRTAYIRAVQSGAVGYYASQAMSGRDPRDSHVGSLFSAGEAATVVPGQVFQPFGPGRMLGMEESRRLLAGQRSGPEMMFDVKIEAGADPGRAAARAIDDLIWRHRGGRMS